MSQYPGYRSLPPRDYQVYLAYREAVEECRGDEWASGYFLLHRFYEFPHEQSGHCYCRPVRVSLDDPRSSDELALSAFVHPVH